MGDQIVPRSEQFDNVKKFITSPKSMEAIAMALPKHITAEKMARVVITAINRTPELLDCDPVSIMQSVLEASQLGLMPDGVLGHGYILPFRDKKTGKKRATFIPGYKGLLDMARRSGEIAWVQAHVVYANDEFRYAYGLEPDLVHVPARAMGKAETGDIIAAYAVAKFKSGEVSFEVMHKDEIEAIRRRAQGRDGPAWVEHYDEMARKTVIRRFSKYLPLNPEIQAVISREELAEAGVIDQYVPEATEAPVIAPTGEAPMSMMDLFTEQLTGSDAQEPPIPEEPDDLPPPPPPFPEEEAVDVTPPEHDEVDKAPEIGQDGTGRISRDEDAAFVAAIYNLKDRFRPHMDEEGVKNTFDRELKAYGVEKPHEIRSRHDREKFYLTLLRQVEKMEAYSQSRK